MRVKRGFRGTRHVRHWSRHAAARTETGLPHPEHEPRATASSRSRPSQPDVRREPRRTLPGRRRIRLQSGLDVAERPRGSARPPARDTLLCSRLSAGHESADRDPAQARRISRGHAGPATFWALGLVIVNSLLYLLRVSGVSTRVALAHDGRVLTSPAVNLLRASLHLRVSDHGAAVPVGGLLFRGRARTVLS